MVTAYPTKIERPLEGAEEMYQNRHSMDSYRSSIASSNHKGIDSYFVVDTGATGHLVKDERLIDTSAHKTLSRPYSDRTR